MDLPADFFVQPVAGSPDLVAFRFGFDLDPEGKALVHELDDGDLLIEGWAAEFEGEDRQRENFTDGAFAAGIKAFLNGPAALCYHHKTDKCMGKVLDLEEVKGRGLRMKARVDGAIRKHPELATYYEQVKKGTLTALSVGGFFGRKMTPQGPRIDSVDLTEISITPVPVHPKPAFAVVAGKALDGYGDEVGEPVEPAPFNVLAPFEDSLERLGRVFEAIETKAVKPKGDYRDLHALALILELEKFSRELPENDGDEIGGKDSDENVDNLVTETRECLQDISKQAHKLAAKLGPLPAISWSQPY